MRGTPTIAEAVAAVARAKRELVDVNDSCVVLRATDARCSRCLVLFRRWQWAVSRLRAVERLRERSRRIHMGRGRETISLGDASKWNGSSLGARSARGDSSDWHRLAVRGRWRFNRS